MKPAYSFILPVLNNCDGFTQAIQSILAQSDELLEIIVIDGGSEDGTLEAIQSFKENIKYRESGKDSGIADAFNRGIKKASGDVIGILNSDDILETDALNKLSQAINTNSQAEIYCGATRYFDPVRNTSYIRKPNISRMKWRMSVFHPSMFVRRSCYDRIGLYDESYTHAMDSEWCHRALAQGAEFFEIPEVMTTMSLGGVSDVEYTISLSQYRDSVIKHGLATPFAAHGYFQFYRLIKGLMRMPFMHPIKRVRDRLISG
ncbi:glycosyltransferase family 2 protein [Marinibactrum halimedae]|uniref:Glycosyltransferase 2-like domain-containing protein n=1 Tax=Marinibactrum halimedae TaxID=1444977 RepID=A0AA37T4X1_9GAMM|nr:glycosyltransferase family 2 protein [Marinibactrum halimedae]MCD9459836.1 glycosyltransferase [Marinibactrum halimedae]GLS26970.1 hypothetical protein GCM10007877_26890 [Marinibactrum halimedae]